MTAEIAVMNKTAVALATDSAVSLPRPGGAKIYNTANKLFALSKYCPVGIMVYGTASFLDVPWETIIKIYRAKLGNKKFQTLQGYTDNFIAFLEEAEILFPLPQRRWHVYLTIAAYFNGIKNEIEVELEKLFKEQKKTTKRDVQVTASKFITSHTERLAGMDYSPRFQKSDIKRIARNFKQEIETAYKDVFEELPLYKKSTQKLVSIASAVLAKEIISTQTPGVVIAGFGENDTFPSLRSFRLQTLVEKRLKYAQEHNVSIDFQTFASVVPFAQSEMVHTFMEGIDPAYADLQKTYLETIFEIYPSLVTSNLGLPEDKKEKISAKIKKDSKKILKSFADKMNDYRRKKHVDPIVNVVGSLPKDDLAGLAEALVNLTSLKRKISYNQEETVGGPIDVAVISKGDGFVWIRRKHYFSKDINAHFFAKYYLGDDDDET